MAEYSALRAYEHEGRIYIFRDVLDVATGKPIRCEYARRTPEDETEWTPCNEGSSFAEVKPYG